MIMSAETDIFSSDWGHDKRIKQGMVAKEMMLLRYENKTSWDIEKIR